VGRGLKWKWCDLGRRIGGSGGKVSRGRRGSMVEGRWEGGDEMSSCGCDKCAMRLWCT
jgi:hypothetical protein